MRQNYPQHSLEELCTSFGISRQAYYQAILQEQKTTMVEDLVLQLMINYRKEIRCSLGVRKSMIWLESQLKDHRISKGKDKVFELLRDHHMLLRRRVRKVKTTDSYHWLKKYSNLIKDLVVSAQRPVMGIGYYLYQHAGRILLSKPDH